MGPPSNAQPEASPQLEDPVMIRFPPFPVPPEGVTIIPFSKFKPNGIQLFAKSTDEEDVEMDGLGIPTVELRVKHVTDQSKSDNRKKKKKKAQTGLSANMKRVPWWEEWEEGEELRLAGGGYNPNMSRVDRLFQVTQDFKSSRTWPATTSGGVHHLWDKFRLYTGLLTHTPVYRKDGSNNADELIEDYMSDEDDIHMMVEPSHAPGSKRKRPDEISATAVQDDDDDEMYKKKKKLGTEDHREDRLFVFLDDPELSIKIFLSSFMREQGLIWTESYLTAAPLLLQFFLKFILRNRVFPESNHEDNIRAALAIIDIAKKELPLTYQISKVLPDDVSNAFKECWGRKGGVVWQSDIAADSGNSEPKATPEVKDPQPVLVAVDGIKATKIEISPASSASEALRQIIQDNIGNDVGLDTSELSTWNDDAPTTGGWGGDTGGWGENASGGWGDYANGGWGDVDDTPWDDSKNDWAGIRGQENKASAWSTSPLYSLTPFIGPSALPLTHTTGIVEFSTRRIKAIIPPTTTPSKSTSKFRVKGGETGPDPASVEDTLDRTFAKIVLEPWIDCVPMKDSDIARPVIKPCSRGPVIVEPGAVPCDMSGAPVSGEKRPYNPYDDDIILLIAPSDSMIENFSIGMGLAALWIQIARLEEIEPDKAAAKDKKGRETTDNKTFWYLEDLMCIFPSYFTPGEAADL